MRATLAPAFLLVGVLAAAGVAPVRAQSAAPAPTAPAPATPAPSAADDAARVQQIALTPAEIEGYLAAKKDMDAVLDKVPDGTDQPDPATMAKLDATAKAHKLDDYRQYDLIDTNVGLVIAGIDPTTKTYIGPEAVIKKQIAQVQADKQLSAKDKKDTVDQLNAAISTIPKVQHPGNIELVTKNYDKLNAAMPQD